MSSLKEINLISVLNNSDEKLLKKIFKNISIDAFLKINEIMSKIDCKLCGFQVPLHFPCSKCNKNNCYSFTKKITYEHYYGYKCKCLECLSDKKFNIINKNKKIYIITGEYKYTIDAWIHKDYKGLSKDELFKKLEKHV